MRHDVKKKLLAAGWLPLAIPLIALGFLYRLAQGAFLYGYRKADNKMSQLKVKYFLDKR